jgi:hypothetical protein
MINPHWTFVVPALFGLLSAAGVWLCYWYQRIGWTITLAANALLISYGIWTEQYGFSIAVPLAAAAQLHHLYRSRREPWTGRRVPGARSQPARTRRRLFRHEIPPGQIIIRTTIPLVEEVKPVSVPPLVGFACPCGCGRLSPSELVTHLERNRGNPSHWAVMNRS